MALIEITLFVQQPDGPLDIYSIPISVNAKEVTDRTLHVDNVVPTLGTFVDHLLPFFGDFLVPIAYINRLLHNKYSKNLADLFGNNGMVIVKMYARSSISDVGKDPYNMFIQLS